jgi:alpha-amylase
MVDIVANNVMATSTTPDLSTYMFKEPVMPLSLNLMHLTMSSLETQYHSYCPIDWNNLTSIQNCWLGDTIVPLPDLNTQDSSIASAYGAWIKNLVQEYAIDGLRIDGVCILLVYPIRLTNDSSLAAK